MCRRKYGVLALSLILCFSVTSCSLMSGSSGKDKPSDSDQSKDSVTSTPSVAPTFGLASNNNPNFSDESPSSSEKDDGLYTMENGYLYELDPTTFEKIGPALDPITREVVYPQPEDANSEDQPTSNDEPKELTEGDASGEVSGNTDSAVMGVTTDSNNGDADKPRVPDTEKLPNTGIFLEDD